MNIEKTWSVICNKANGALKNVVLERESKHQLVFYAKGDLSGKKELLQSEWKAHCPELDIHLYSDPIMATPALPQHKTPQHKCLPKRMHLGRFLFIKKLVACEFDITIEELEGPRRNRAVVLPRQTAFYLCKYLIPDASCVAIARAGVSSTSPMSGCINAARYTSFANEKTPPPKRYEQDQSHSFPLFLDFPA